jgi:hypothetical protein
MQGNYYTRLFSRNKDYAAKSLIIHAASAACIRARFSSYSLGGASRSSPMLVCNFWNLQPTIGLGLRSKTSCFLPTARAQLLPRASVHAFPRIHSATPHDQVRCLFVFLGIISQLSDLASGRKHRVFSLRPALSSCRARPVR